MENNNDITDVIFLALYLSSFKLAKLLKITPPSIGYIGKILNINKSKFIEYKSFIKLTGYKKFKP